MIVIKLIILKIKWNSQFKDVVLSSKIYYDPGNSNYDQLLLKITTR